MKIRLHPAVLAAALSAAIFASGNTETDTKKSPGDVRKQIDALLKHRLRPQPLPVDPPNPFTATSYGAGVVRLSGSDANASAAAGDGARGTQNARPRESFMPGSNAELLSHIVPRLKIGGMIRLKDQVQIIINESPWREGDFIVLDRGDKLLRLQVAKIEQGQLTLRLEDAEQVVRF